MKLKLFLSLSAISLLTTTMAQAQLPTELSATARDSYNFNRDSTTTLFAGKGTFIRVGRPASAVFVADPNIADVEIKFPQMIYVYAKRPGDTTVHVLDEDGKTILNETIKVFLNIDQAKSAMAELLPNQSIEVRSVNDSLVIGGTVNSTRDADFALRLARRFAGNDDNIINMINIQESNQITLKVRIVELSRSLSKNFGIDWNFQSQQGNFNNVGGTIAPLAITERFGFRNTFGAGGTNIDTLLQALETEGLATILAEPNLTTISGEDASFLAGGSFPTIVPQPNGTFSTEYRPFGVALSFAPQLLSENRIRLKVRPQVSSLGESISAGGFDFPTLQQREAETTVELGDGQSFTIAGILQNEMVESIRKFPGLGDIPVLGALFRSQSFERKETELVIIVTPYIVEPVSHSNLATPLDDVYVPTDSDRILYGQTMSSTLRPSRVFLGRNASRLSGPVGFILD